MKICILEADRPAEPFRPTHGTYAAMFERWLGPALPEARFTHLDVAGGAALPADPHAFDGYLITGSRAGVYDAHPWIAPLEAFLRDLAAARLPMAGVCFGHQIMAQALGGTVRKAAGGWIVGRQTHALTPEGRALFGTGPLSALSFHQDQVLAPPAGATRLLGHPASPNGGLIYAGCPAISVQFHPEFHPGFVRDLLVSAAGIRLPAVLAEAALGSLGAPLDGARVARGFATFYRRNVGAAARAGAETQAEPGAGAAPGPGRGAAPAP